MDRTRMIVLAVAAVAAGAVALLARSLLGGGTAPTVAAPAPHVAMSDVLVAAADLTPGTQLTTASVRWQEWPQGSVDSSYITRQTSPDISKFVQGEVVRAPMMPGEPLSVTKVVHADPVGYMAARLMPGMRALSIPITVDTGAGGFILPNDHVDILCTQQIGDTKRYRTTTILPDVRVLAVDQTLDSKDNKTVVGRTATLELSPDQVELVERAKAGGAISLALRGLGDSNASATAAANATPKKKPAETTSNEIAVIRYSIERPSVVGASGSRE